MLGKNCPIISDAWKRLMRFPKENNCNKGCTMYFMRIKTLTPIKEKNKKARTGVLKRPKYSSVVIRIKVKRKMPIKHCEF